jgi:hypothetical protein
MRGIRNDMLKSLIFLLTILIAPHTLLIAQISPILMVDTVISHADQYASQMIVVRGEAVDDYHGPILEDLKTHKGFFIYKPDHIDPEPDFKLERDNTYLEYERLRIEIGNRYTRLEKARLIATLRGRYDLFILEPDGKVTIIRHPKKDEERLVRHRFVLQEVIKLEIQKLK